MGDLSCSLTITMSVQVERPNEAELEVLISAGGGVVVHFAADWCGPSKQMAAVVKTCPPSPNVTHVQVEAEDVPGTSIKHNVVSVPTFILFHGGSEVGRIEGADAPSLVRAIDDLGKKKKVASAAEAAAKAQKKLERRMQGIIDSAPVVLFMKGTPSGPQCGFSRKAIATLSAIQVEDGGSLVESKWFNSFNILDDNDVRQGLKAYSNWPTFPQLYVSGSLLGGLDIMNEMAEDGDLEDAILEACAAGAALFERLAG